MDKAIEKVILIAKNEIGYLEKKSNSQLDSKTANAGSNNYTKYWRDIKPSYQGQRLFRELVLYESIRTE